VQNLFSSRLLSKNLKIKINRTIILPIVLYECEIWSLTLREEKNEHVLRVNIVNVFEVAVLGIPFIM